MTYRGPVRTSAGPTPAPPRRSRPTGTTPSPTGPAAPPAPPENARKRFEQLQQAGAAQHPPVKLTLNYHPKGEVPPQGQPEPEDRFEIQAATPQGEEWLKSVADKFGFKAIAGKDHSWSFQDPQPNDHSTDTTTVTQNGQTSQLPLPAPNGGNQQTAPNSTGTTGGGYVGARSSGVRSAPTNPVDQVGGGQVTDPYSDIPADLQAMLKALGPNATPDQIQKVLAQYNAAHPNSPYSGDPKHLQDFTAAGPLPTQFFQENAHGGQCGAWMMAMRGKMGLPTWDFACAKDLMWNHPANMQVVKQPKVGDAFIMTNPPYGHTGFVTAINNDGTVSVMDSNWHGDEIEHAHKIPMSEIAGYLENN